MFTTETLNYTQLVKTDIIDWLESVRHPERPWGRFQFHSKMLRPWSLQASSIAVRIFKMIGELDNLPAEHIQDIKDYFYSCYDEEKRLFRDPLENESLREGKHDWKHIWGQRNGAVIEAFEHMGENPQTETILPEFLADIDNIDPRQWVLNLNWQDPWLSGEVWSRLLIAFVNKYPGKDIVNEIPFVTKMIETMESEILDEDTGMPILRGCQDDKPVAMAGLFKIIHGYQFIDRSIPNPQNAIDFTLQLQHENGEFGHKRDMTMNWDSLDLISKVSDQLNNEYRFDDIVEAGNKTAEVLLTEYKKQDGGFAFYGEQCLDRHCSVLLSHERYPISDMLGTNAALICFKYIDRWNDIAAQ
ncbi:MAG: hypothetical protein ACIAQZ_13450 [Sedimentisphaeraceae bacterium JB056]